MTVYCITDKSEYTQHGTLKIYIPLTYSFAGIPARFNVIWFLVEVQWCTVTIKHVLNICKQLCIAKNKNIVLYLIFLKFYLRFLQLFCICLKGFSKERVIQYIKFILRKFQRIACRPSLWPNLNVCHPLCFTFYIISCNMWPLHNQHSLISYWFQKSISEPQKGNSSRNGNRLVF